MFEDFDSILRRIEGHFRACELVDFLGLEPEDITTSFPDLIERRIDDILEEMGVDVSEDTDERY